MTSHADPALSPSGNHRLLMEQGRPALTYDPAGPAGAAGAAGVADPAGLAGWQRTVRGRLTSLLGLPDPQRPPLTVRTRWRQEHELGTIEKIEFPAEPGADIVAYFCTPSGVTPPYPVVICLQGHTTGMHHSIARKRDDETRPEPVEGDRDFAVGALRHGYAALCIEQRGFGERRERLQDAVSPHGCHDAAMHALMLGRTLLGERVYDVDRGIDYLTERGDVDLARVGVMGNSGGGTVTMYAAALLDRVRFAMPSCAFCTFADSIMSIYHCADNYVPGILRWMEAADVLGAFAPKPVVVVTGRDDPLFPLAGVRTAFDRLHRIYADAGAPGRCRLVIGEGGHRFYADAAWPALAAVLGDVS